MTKPKTKPTAKTPTKTKNSVVRGPKKTLKLPAEKGTVEAALAPSSTDSVQSLLAKGLNFLKTDQLTEARSTLESVLQLQPEQIDALHMLGVIQSKTKDPAGALSYFDRAIKKQPDYAVLHHSRGNALQELKRPQEALTSYDKALAISPGYALAHGARAKVLTELGRHEEAIAIYKRLLDTAPQNTDYIKALGTAYLVCQNYPEALRCMDTLLKLKPEAFQLNIERAIILVNLERYDEALQGLERVLSADPSTQRAHHMKAQMLWNLRRYAECFNACADTLKLHPDMTEVWLIHGAVLQQFERFPESLVSFEQALKHCPVDKDPYSLIRMNMAISNFKLGNLSLAWPLYEARWPAKLSKVMLQTTRPRWQGQNSRHVLLWSEQGIGDQLLYSSLLPEVLLRAAQVTLSLDARLMPLFARSFPTISPVDAHTDSSAIDYECHAPLGSIGEYFRPDMASFDRQPALYLKADATRAHQFRMRLKGSSSAKIIGLSWFSTNPEDSHFKNIDLAALLPILSMPNCVFVDLQYGDTRLAREQLRASTGVVVHKLEDLDNFNDLDGLAALLCACDHVVTVSNTTAHLAGALGVPTSLLTSKSGRRLWYWFSGDGKSLWYPSIEMFCQPQLGDWAGAVGRVSEHLKNIPYRTS